VPLQKLLAKVRASADPTEVVAAASPSATTVERDRLMSIVGKYGMTDSDVAALLRWRHSHEF